MAQQNIKPRMMCQAHQDMRQICIYRRGRETVVVCGVPMKRLIVFDLDGTIAESKSSLDDEMSALLRDLLSIVKGLCKLSW